MASMTRHRTLVNPGTRRRKRKRNMSLKQLLHFGSKRQRAGAASRIKNAFNRKQKRAQASNRKVGKGSSAKSQYYGKSHFARRARKYIKSRSSWFGLKSLRPKLPNGRRKRRKNVGTILSVIPNGRKSRVRKRYVTGATKLRRRRAARYKKRTRNRTTIKVYNKRRRANKGMARTRRRKRTSNRSHSTYRRRRRTRAVNPVRRRRRRTRNVRYVKRISRGLYKYSNPRRRRRSRVSSRRYSRRRNSGLLSGGAGKIVGIIGGAAVTALLSKFIPGSLSGGFMGYVSKGIVAVLQGKLVGKMSGSRALGQDFMYGGLAYVAIGVLSDMFGLNLPGFGLRGMGLIAPSSFYVPQVNAPGSMGSFVRPAAIGPAYVPSAGGMGNVRRGGRVR